MKAKSFLLRKVDKDNLQSYTQEELEGVPVKERTFSRTERISLLGELGEKVALNLLQEALPNADIKNANSLKMNQPGYDLIVNGTTKVQVKGRAWVELIDFALPNLSKEKAWDSDLFIIVDFGPQIDGRFGKHSMNQVLAPKQSVDFYIAPTAELKEWVMENFGNDPKTRIKAYNWKVPSKRKSFPELLKYKDAFQHITSIVETASSPV